ncbi:hypothetical protein ABMA28_001561 [Loxostege sticticalis]|uniref:Craniofacial development protein 2-like n=1 Tax=Loxostege sticticalis TaxID=481309 RepID=A0ABD0T230_LOXSC
MGDFNAKLGKRGDGELKVGEFGYGQRNSRGQRLAEFLEKEDLFMMNSFFRKPPQRKWTWMSPDGSTKNEIDFIMTTERRMFSDVSVKYLEKDKIEKQLLIIIARWRSG